MSSTVKEPALPRQAPTQAPTQVSGPGAADWRDYLRIARFDHMTKHIFIVPGIVLAFLLMGPLRTEPTTEIAFNILVGFLAAVAIASANYVINEWLDRDFDRFHPEKSQRAAVQREMSGVIVAAEYVAFLVVGFALSWVVNADFFFAAALLALSGVTYNVRPIRTKDRVYADVLSESLNNPIRLMMGWAMVDAVSLPPSSLLLAFWFGGAFLMNSKRLAEYRDIVASDGVETLHRYRRSFRYYTTDSLSVANLIYALFCAFFVAIFLIKYRIEYVLLFPCIVLLFAVYYALSLKPGSVARKPEKLYSTRPVVLAAALTTVVFLGTTFYDVPMLETLTSQRYIDFPLAASR